MWRLRQILVVCATALLACEAVRADIAHRVSFSVGPQILVSTTDGPIHSGERIAITSQGETVLSTPPSGHPVVTGRLLQVSFADRRSTSMHLRVATNTPFRIYAESPDGSPWFASVRLVSVGSNATAGGALPVEGGALSQVPVPIFTAVQRTALVPGDPMTQSLLLQVTLTPAHVGVPGMVPRLEFRSMQ